MIMATSLHEASPWMQTTQENHEKIPSESFNNNVQENTKIPKSFIWPKNDLIVAQEDLNEPLVDLEGFFRGDPDATQKAVNQIKKACLSHGFFQVINHGLDAELIDSAYDHARAFFKLPFEEKLKAKKPVDSMWGYSNAHAARFYANLPWKETVSFHVNVAAESDEIVEYFKSIFGESHEQIGLAFEKYSEGMKKLSAALLEIVSLSLGVDPSYFKDLFEDGKNILRCNYYPPCNQPEVTLGTGPHSDTTSLTILHQDQVGGLEVFSDNKWKAVRPRHDAFVINIGDTFKALTNGEYQSCLHKAVVNKEKERLSFACFVCPQEEKLLSPPPTLITAAATSRKYPDFKWSQFLEFTQKHHRADQFTLDQFTNMLTNNNNINSY